MVATAPTSSGKTDPTARVPAGALPPWDVGELPAAPVGGWRGWLRLLGPGVLLAGASIGSGEWLAGPGISAQYGGTLLWVASLSIICQVFCNLEMMRYALYCGEPVVVGFFRTLPGPVFWTFAYLALDFAAIWPFNASNAAVPLAAAILGRLPGDGVVYVLGLTMSEALLVKILGYTIFLSAFLPLIFGGTIYKMLERIFAFKLVVVLIYLVTVSIFMVSAPTATEVFTGFFRFGSVPLRADTIVAGRHFSMTEQQGSAICVLKGTLRNSGGPEIVSFTTRALAKGQESGLTLGEEQAIRRRMVERAVSLAKRGRFFVEDTVDGVTVSAAGAIVANRSWQAEEFSVSDSSGRREFKRLEELPPPKAAHVRELIANQGLERVSMAGYFAEHGRLPGLDWALLATFAAIAGAGGMTNTLFSNYAREKGWGMGAHVGAIPSAVGGKTIKLSHVGMVFPLTETSRRRWRGWMRHIVRDQLVVWMFCSFVGMALPCMLSLEFIRHAPVAGDRVAAMTADGMADRYPQYAHLLWLLTLSIGFLILAPGQIMAGDSLSRRWTDILWTSNRQTRRLDGHKVKYIYYGILATYCLWGLIALSLFDPLQVLKIGGVLMNFALGFTAWHTLYVNHMLLPRELRPNWFMAAGTLICGVFFFAISLVVLLGLVGYV